MANQALVDRMIMDGYELLSRNETARACDIWLDAWEGLKTLMAECGVENVQDIHNRYNWSEFPANYAQELEQELHNAGLDDPEYFRKRIAYCKELIKYVGEDKLMAGNTRRAIADSYFEIGDAVECDRLYEQWLKDDPAWGWGYIGWSRNYEYKPRGRQDMDKAREIKELGLNMPGVRDRLDVVDDALVFYEGNGGDATKIATLREEFARLKAASPMSMTSHAPIPVTSSKIGRNDPCPCGSGKKYKKCHGAGGAE